MVGYPRELQFTLLEARVKLVEGGSAEVNQRMANLMDIVETLTANMGDLNHVMNGLLK